MTFIWDVPRLVGRYCSYLLPKQAGVTPQIKVNRTEVRQEMCHPVYSYSCISIVKIGGVILLGTYLGTYPFLSLASFRAPNLTRSKIMFTEPEVQASCSGVTLSSPPEEKKDYSRMK